MITERIPQLKSFTKEEKWQLMVELEEECWADDRIGTRADAILAELERRKAYYVAHPESAMTLDEARRSNVCLACMSEVIPLFGADGDLIQLFNHFEDVRSGMGADFDREFVKACDLLASHPQIGPKWRAGFRRLLMIHWNLGIFYEVSGERVLIHGIMDVRRDPDEIAGRLGLR